MVGELEPQIRLLEVFKILRKRTIVEHLTPSKRQFTEELTLFNNDAQPHNFIMLLNRNYRPAMEITDDDGRSLPFFRNMELEAVLKDSNNVEYQDLLHGMRNHEVFIQLIQFPGDRPFVAKSMRVIRIRYVVEKVDIDTFYWRKLIFNISTDYVDGHMKPTDDYSMVVIIKPPEDFRVDLEAVVIKEDGKESRVLREDAAKNPHFHVTAADNIISMNLTSDVSTEEFDFNIYYTIFLERNEERLITGLTISSLAIPSILAFLTFYDIRYHVWKINSPLTNAFNLMFTAIIFTQLTFIGLWSNPLTHRSKIWVVAGLGLIVIVFVMSAVYSPFGM